MARRRFGQLLGGIMERRRIAVIDIARELSVSQQTVKLWLGDLVVPTAEDLARLAGLLTGDDRQLILDVLAEAGGSEVEVAPGGLETELVRDLPAVFQQAFAEALARNQDRPAEPHP
jgi:transcriptional regulator with XRE-family HTH domain